MELTKQQRHRRICELVVNAETLNTKDLPAGKYIILKQHLNERW